MAEETAAELIGVREAHRFDEGALERYLAAHLVGFTPPMAVRQFDAGHSNPTFLVSAGGRDYVVRKKPPGELLPSAHAVEREYRVITALRETDVPVARTYLLCEDASVIGTPFFVMERLQGRIFRDLALAGRDATERRAVFREMMRVQAALHGVDHGGVGLGDFGRPGNYCRRQIGRWTKQYLASQTEEIVSIDRLMEWLPERVPEQEETTLVHGDFGMHNVVFDAKAPRVIGVLDWELSTLGNPFSDVAYFCLRHLVDDPRFRPLRPGDGVPTITEIVADYCGFAGKEAIRDWTFYLAFNLFRLAAISQGVYQRGVQGNAASSRVFELEGQSRRIADAGWRVAQEGAPAGV